MRPTLGFLAVLLAVGLSISWYVSTFDRSESPWIEVPREPAVAADWQEIWIETDPFDLLAYTRFEQPGAEALVVYLEGDGLGWISLTKFSDDPSPRSARVLEMALTDRFSNVAYLSRPCFYLPPNDLTGCPSRYWSEARYSGEAVAALDRELDRLKADVAGIITVSASLDHAAWTTRHNISPLIASLNAADIAHLVEDIPQVHFIGANDKVVGRPEVDAYIAHERFIAVVRG